MNRRELTAHEREARKILDARNPHDARRGMAAAVLRLAEAVREAQKRACHMATLYDLRDLQRRNVAMTEERLAAAQAALGYPTTNGGE